MNTIAKKIAGALGAQLKAERGQIDIFTYGLELLLGTIFQAALLVVLSLLLNIFTTTMVCFLAFASLRFVGGGAHLSSYLSCSLFGVSLLIGLGELATLVIPPALLTFISASTILVGFYVIFKWAPAGTAKKQIKDEAMRLKQKKKALLVLMLWSFCLAILLTLKMTAETFAVALGVLGCLFLITPLGYEAAKSIDNMLNITGRRCNND